MQLPKYHPVFSHIHYVTEMKLRDVLRALEKLPHSVWEMQSWMAFQMEFYLVERKEVVLHALHGRERS